MTPKRIVGIAAEFIALTVGTGVWFTIAVNLLSMKSTFLSIMGFVLILSGSLLFLGFAALIASKIYTMLEDWHIKQGGSR